MDILVTGATGFLGTRFQLTSNRWDTGSFASARETATSPGPIRSSDSTIAVTTRSITSRPGPRRATSACATRASNGSSINRSIQTSSPGGRAASPRPS